MIELDPGHAYKLASLDGEADCTLVFVKREGPGYPGNVGHHPGTNIQEVLRALIARVKYLNNQIPCEENSAVVDYFRLAIASLELRAARRHNRPVLDIESLPTCSRCGHIGCADSHIELLPNFSGREVVDGD